jgi:pilus assembly protein Flp/PilA
MKNLFTSFVKDESGATAIEYGLIAALIAVVLIGILTTLGTTLQTKFAAICKGLNNNVACTPAAQ